MNSVSSGKWVFWGFIVVAAFFVVAEHRAHAIEFLPYLLLLACPLMHLLHGHGAHGGQEDREHREHRHEP